MGIVQLRFSLAAVCALFRGNLSLLYGSTEGTKPPRLRACREGGVFWLVGVLG